MLNSLNPAISRAFAEGKLGTGAPKVGSVEDGNEFGQQLLSALKEVNAMQQDSRGMQEDFVTNRKPVEVHDLMISMERAGTAMQLTMSVRNKVLEAYQEVARMQV